MTHLSIQLEATSTVGNTYYPVSFTTHIYTPDRHDTGTPSQPHASNVNNGTINPFIDYVNTP